MGLTTSIRMLFSFRARIEEVRGFQHKMGKEEVSVGRRRKDERRGRRGSMGRRGRRDRVEWISARLFYK